MTYMQLESKDRLEKDAGLSAFHLAYEVLI